MTLKEFKSMAQRYGSVYNNKESASKEWARTWGLSWWRSLWYYKEYTYKGYIYRSGKVFTRHTNFSQTEFLFGKTEISKSDFLRAIKQMEYKEPETAIQSVPRKQKTCIQLSFNF